MLKLIGHHILTGVIVCKSGLRIGGSDEPMDVGGIDNPILRHPITRLPYLPGSSIKGKVRSLLEIKYQSHSESIKQGKPCDCGRCDICRIFGCSYAKNTQTISRAIFRDCNLTEKSRKILDSAREEFGLFYSEVKTEVLINRQTGCSFAEGKKSGLRKQERIPEGSEFDLEIVLRIFEGDQVEKDVAFIKEGLELLQNDTLGGSGTRGYGKVEILNLTSETRSGKAA